MKHLRRKSTTVRPDPERDPVEEYGRHVHREGADEGEFRFLPCLCNRPHSHRRVPSEREIVAELLGVEEVPAEYEERVEALIGANESASLWAHWWEVFRVWRRA